MDLPKMAPGQEAYTPEEWERVQALIRDAATLQEELSPEDMDWMERDLANER